MPGTVHPMTLAGPAGNLEALWKEPVSAARGSAVVGHAHPLHGGTMHFKVVFRMARALARAGFGVLRFNFRGVGTSQGVHDDGRGERDDFRAALDHAERLGGGPLLAAGFSFGSAMALEAGAGDARVSFLIAAGLPVDRWRFSGTRIGQPALVISGELDAIADTKLLRTAVPERFDRARLELVPGADHFFTGHLDVLEERVFAFASGAPLRAAARESPAGAPAPEVA